MTGNIRSTFTAYPFGICDSLNNCYQYAKANFPEATIIVTGTGWIDSKIEDGNCDTYSIYPDSGLTDIGHKFLGEKLAYEFEKILREEE